jgi:hypothetical protein
MFPSSDVVELKPIAENRRRHRRAARSNRSPLLNAFPRVKASSIPIGSAASNTHKWWLCIGLVFVLEREAPEVFSTLSLVSGNL